MVLYKLPIILEIKKTINKDEKNLFINHKINIDLPVINALPTTFSESRLRSILSLQITIILTEDVLEIFFVVRGWKMVGMDGDWTHNFRSLLCVRSLWPLSIGQPLVLGLKFWEKGGFYCIPCHKTEKPSKEKSLPAQCFDAWIISFHILMASTRNKRSHLIWLRTFFFPVFVS